MANAWIDVQMSITNLLQQYPTVFRWHQNIVVSICRENWHLQLTKPIIAPSGLPQGQPLRHGRDLPFGSFSVKIRRATIQGSRIHAFPLSTTEFLLLGARGVKRLQEPSFLLSVYGCNSKNFAHLWIAANDAFAGAGSGAGQ